jgi:Site-specific recombinase XerD
MPANPITGKPPYRTSVDGDTEEQARLKMSKRVAAMSENAYQTPSYMKLSVWLEKYCSEYMDNLKPNTKIEYENTISRYLKPTLGKYRLFELNPSLIKGVYNDLQKKSARGGVSAKTIRNINALLHSAMENAVFLGYVQRNPTDSISLPRVEKKEMQVIQGEDVARFLDAIKGHRHESLYFVDMFSGLRQGEILGLTWGCIDFKAGTITVRQQLQRERKKGGAWRLVSLKTDDKSRRTLNPAPVVMDALRHVRVAQAQAKLALGSEHDNPMNLVFTHPNGQHLTGSGVYKALKTIVKRLGLNDIRFHDLRHSFALYALQNGDSLKEIQAAMGHSNIATTMDVYGHVSPQMQRESAARMDAFVRSMRNKKA